MTKPTTTRVKPAFILPAPNDDIFAWGGRLDSLRRGVRTAEGVEPREPVHFMDSGPLGRPHCWLEPEIFEKFCDEDAGLQGQILQILKGGVHDDDWRSSLADEVCRIFDDQYLALLRDHLRQRREAIAEYLLAKAAWRRCFPEDLQESSEVTAAPTAPEVSPKKRKTKPKR